jgi:hypothetical protein
MGTGTGPEVIARRAPQNKPPLKDVMAEPQDKTPSAKPKPKRETVREPKRLNRAVAVSEALGRALDPALKKRGFASRDLLQHWAVIAPEPYGRVSRPEKLSWPRGERGAGGAVLYICCHPGHALALSHEGDRLAQAINRYFGYVLVDEVRLSAAPFLAEPPKKPGPPVAPPERAAAIAQQVKGIEDEGLREALAGLGRAIAARREG